MDIELAMEMVDIILDGDWSDDEAVHIAYQTVMLEHGDSSQQLITGR